MAEFATASGLESASDEVPVTRTAYAVVIEAGSNNYSAYVPDLPGCIATGVTVPEVTHRIRRVIAMHTAGPLEDGLPIPSPTAGRTTNSGGRGGPATRR